VRNIKTREGMEYWDKICALEHYGFLHSPDNKRILKTPGIGNWIDKFEAQCVVDQAQDRINDLTELLRQIRMAPVLNPELLNKRIDEVLAGGAR